MADSSQEESVPKKTVFESITSEAGGFYRQVLTIASAFLGGTILFFDKLKVSIKPLSLILLFLGWLCLIVVIALSGIIRLKNLESGRLALDNEIEKARKLDSRKENWSEIMLWFLIAGIFLITLFGIINLACGYL